MKFNGVRPDTPNEVIVAIPRPEKPFIFVCRSVTNWDMFYEQAPSPKPPLIEEPGKEPRPNVLDKQYQKANSEHSELWHAFLIVQSLKETPGLEWENVKLEDVHTYPAYEQELKDAFFTDIEIGRIVAGCHEANSMNEDAIEKARADFLVSRRRQS